MKIWAIVILAVSALLAACAKPVPQTSNIQSAYPVASTTVTQSPSQSFTPLPSQTRTPAPAQTETPRPRPTITLRPTSTPDWYATYTQIARAVMTATPAKIIESQRSPDGKWRIELVRNDCVDVGINEGGMNAYEQLRLVKTSDGNKKTIADQLQFCEGIGAYGLGIVYWSTDSRYLYYTTCAYGVPDGGGLAWYRPLYRYEIESEAITTLDWGPLAPDGVTMAYPDERELALYLWNINKGEIARIPSSLSPNSPWPGIYDIAWSPDGKSLAYIEAENSDGIDGKSWIILLNLATFERKVIYQAESGQLGFKWQGRDQIQLWLNNEFQNMKLPPMTGNEVYPTSLWCERPDDLAVTRVEFTHLPGALQSMCIVWEEEANHPSGYHVVIRDEGWREVFQYRSGPFGTQWIIPLETFGNQGINLTNVDKIAIGLGTRGNMTTAGGSGKMYIDDIRLYR